MMFVLLFLADTLRLFARHIFFPLFRVRLDVGSTTVCARIVKEADARLLQIPANYPILLAQSINCDRDETIVEYGVTRFSGEMMELIFSQESNYF